MSGDDWLDRVAALAFAPFRARVPWFGADLQTLRNYLRPSPALAGSQRLTLALEDGTGDRLAASLSEPDKPSPGRPLVVLIHGLSGNEDSHYVRNSAAAMLALGYRVLRINLRGAGASRPMSRFQYHAGRTGDFECALAALPPALTADGIVAVGYSLGGNMLLKFLGERGAGAPLRAGVSVSAPIDLGLTSARMQAWRNAPYQAFMMGEMRKEAVAPASELSKSELAVLQRVQSIRAFDEGFTVPRNDFRSVDAYYDQSSARHFLDGIKVPTLVIHARNDPWVPAEPYLAFNWRSNPYLVPQLTPSGGHVGFHASGGRTAWHDRAIGQFFEALFSPT